jgi:hypothetical protein
MPNAQVTTLVILQFFTLFIIIRQRQLLRNHALQCRGLAVSSSIAIDESDGENSNDDDFDMLLAIPYPSHVPRSPPIVRSDDWITRVIDGLLLQGQEFVRNFRMTRESFDHLHAILSMLLINCLSAVLIDHRTPYSITRYQISTCNRKSSPIIDISLSCHARCHLSYNLKSVCS